MLDGQRPTVKHFVAKIFFPLFDTTKGLQQPCYWPFRPIKYATSEFLSYLCNNDRVHWPTMQDPMPTSFSGGQTLSEGLGLTLFAQA